MTAVDPAGQAVTFLLSVVLGAVLALYYCFFKAMRLVGSKSWATVFFQDIFFWVSAAVVTYCFFILRCRGEIRFFVYAGMLIGFTLYRVLLTKFTVKILKFPLEIFKKICRFLSSICRKISGWLKGLLEKGSAWVLVSIKKFKIKQKKA